MLHFVLVHWPLNSAHPGFWACWDERLIWITDRRLDVFTSIILPIVNQSSNRITDYIAIVCLLHSLHRWHRLSPPWPSIWGSAEVHRRLAGGPMLLHHLQRQTQQFGPHSWQQCWRHQLGDGAREGHQKHGQPQFTAEERTVSFKRQVARTVWICSVEKIKIKSQP